MAQTSMIPVTTGLLIVLAVLLLSGVATAAFSLALYLGERGRRRDLAWLVDKERKKWEEATVSYDPEPETEALELVEAHQKERLIEDLMHETGRSYDDAKAEAERLIEHYHRMGADGW